MPVHPVHVLLAANCLLTHRTRYPAEISQVRTCPIVNCQDNYPHLLWLLTNQSPSRDKMYLVNLVNQGQ